ncbi:peptide chain release factor N(5)-glutamine methyltransferase [Neisseria sp. Ec49-e6-T10]|uniref:peptide chain release factor N(5)-glutamine methyltransferase n=1 Tax=Neisseria sp. Ec49-e6-T10 TaxID=3140744 RepID=UPI003EBA648F
MLLQMVTGYSKAQLISHDQEALNAQTLQELNHLSEQRLNGLPMAYIIHHREFFGRYFNVTPKVLIPRPETEHLIETVLEKLTVQDKPTIWDLGTGSGIIAITLKLECPQSTVFASDLSEEALAIARQNAQQLNADIQFFQGSWFEAFPHSQSAITFDFLVSNPPYIEANDPHLLQGDLRFEPAMALTDFGNGLSAFQTLVQQGKQYLKPQGWLIMEHGFEQAEAIRALLTQYGYHHIETKKDLAGLDRISLGQHL